MGQSNTAEMPLSQTFEYPKTIVIGGIRDAGKFTFATSMQRLFPKLAESPFEYSDEEFEKDLQTISCLIIKRLFLIFNENRSEYEQFHILEKALNSEFDLHDFQHLEMDKINARINSKLNCKLILVKLWKYFGLKEFYEAFWITNSYLGENLKQLIENIAEQKRSNFYPKALFYPKHKIKSYYNEKIAFFDFFTYRKSLHYINPEAAVHFISLSNFNESDSLGFIAFNESKLLVSEMMDYSERHSGKCKKILIFTKPDVLIRKLNRKIKYNRELDREIRSELEEIEEENVKLIINSIISEFIKAVGVIDSYHIVNLTVDSELLQVCDLIFGKRKNYNNKPFISRCLIPFKIPTKMFHYQKTGILTDLIVITNNSSHLQKSLEQLL